MIKSAVLVSSNFNLYASTLIARLVKEGKSPTAVICARRNHFRSIHASLRRKGGAGTIRKILDVLGMRRSGANPLRTTLNEYSDRHGLSFWNLPVKSLCRIHGIQNFAVKAINHPKTIDRIKGCGIDLLLNTAGEIYKKPFIEAAPLGVLNAHMGILPRYRGYNVLEWSLFQNDPVGVTLHFIDDGIDTGTILEVRRMEVEAQDTIETLRAKSFPVFIELMVQAVNRISAGEEIRGQRQPKGIGRQYFSMHPRIKAIVEKRLRSHGQPFPPADRP